MTKLLQDNEQDVNGKTSSTRRNQKINNYWLIALITIISAICTYRGTDVGGNLATLLGTVFGLNNIAAEAKKSIEHFKKN